MTLPITLSKLHATGNDFLVHVAHGGSAPPVIDAARLLCDRHLGIGADGLLVLDTERLPAGTDCTMILINADGTRAEMSGNGIRCLAAVARGRGLGTSDRLAVASDAGVRVLDLALDAAGRVVRATCDMGPVSFDPPAIPLDAPSPFGLTAEFHGVRYEGDAAGIGNPHLVLFVDDPATARVVQHGARLERDPRFPHRTNVEFVAPTPGERDAMTMRVWERGVGETLSCGTGACAAAAAAHRRGLVGEHVAVHAPGGTLQVGVGDTIRLGGPVVAVFDVTVDLDALADREAAGERG